MKKILVFGAGPLGSILAARLHQGGQDVSLLARGQRLTGLRSHGVCLRNWFTGEEETIPVPLIERFSTEDFYDLVIVVMRKNSALHILPRLAENKNVPLYLFLMNNAAGPEAFIQHLGTERVMVGFPGMAGYRDGNFITYISADAEHPVGIVIGETDGKESERTRTVASQLDKGHHIRVVIEPHMDAWSKYHVALLFPALTPALYLCGNDHMRLSRTRDAVVLAWRGIKEGFAVLKKLGYPMRPPYFKRLLWLPEPLMIPLFQKALKNPRMEVAMARHAEVIRDEITQLNNEFRVLIERSGLFTPTIDFLMGQFNDKAPLLPDGAHTLRLRWSELLIPLLLLMLLVLVLIYFI
jgi:2-dehydropantoate 2-reductase